MKGSPVPETTANNGTAPGAVTDNGCGIGALIAEAEALKGLLRDAYARTNQLLVCIRRHKKAGHAVQQAMQSLRQLQIHR